MEIFSGNGSQRLLLSPTRIYDPVTGRFFQNEPLLHKRPRAQYTYVFQNSVMSVDPSGLDTKQRTLVQRLLDANKLSSIPPEPGFLTNKDIAERFLRNDKATDALWSHNTQQPEWGSKWEQQEAYLRAQEAWRTLESRGVVDPGYQRWGPFDPSSPIEREGSTDPCSGKESYEKEQKQRKLQEALIHVEKMHEAERSHEARATYVGPFGPEPRTYKPGDFYYGTPNAFKDGRTIAAEQGPNAPQVPWPFSTIVPGQNFAEWWNFGNELFLKDNLTMPPIDPPSFWKWEKLYPRK